MDPDLGIYKHRKTLQNDHTYDYLNNDKNENDENDNDDSMKDENNDDYYDGYLLELAIDLGDRLLPAFDTPTAIPYGTVNLRYGVPRGETTVSSLAGSGSLTLEFTMLSQLTGNVDYKIKSQLAVFSLLEKRTDLGLLGKHVNIRSGKWSESISGLGSNADSFYEYILKMYLLFGEEEWWWTFLEIYESINNHLKKGDWFQDVDTFNGQNRRSRFENLMAFWPGVLVLMGEIDEGARILNAFFLVWHDWGFLPEEFDFVSWQLSGTNMYPLRPELIESIYLMHQATHDDSWLWAGQDMMTSLQKYTKTKCGYATIKNMATLELGEEMPSYYLAETLKYLYLLYDPNNFIHKKPYIFSTEAHPFLSVSNGYLSTRNITTTAKKSQSTNDEVEIEVDIQGQTIDSTQQQKIQAEKEKEEDVQKDKKLKEDEEEEENQNVEEENEKKKWLSYNIVHEDADKIQHVLSSLSLTRSDGDDVVEWYKAVYALKERLIDHNDDNGGKTKNKDVKNDENDELKNEKKRNQEKDQEEPINEDPSSQSNNNNNNNNDHNYRMESLSESLQSLQTIIPHWLSHFSYDPNFSDSLADRSLLEIQLRRDQGQNQKLHKHNKHLKRNDPSNQNNHIEDDDVNDDVSFLGYDRYLYNSYYEKKQPISTWSDSPPSTSSSLTNKEDNKEKKPEHPLRKRKDLSKNKKGDSKEGNDKEEEGTILSMGELGTFQVSVFIDGFLVKHIESNEVIEISNIGSGIVSVVNKNYNANSKKIISKSITANNHGMHITCSLKLINKDSLNYGLKLNKNMNKNHHHHNNKDDDDDDNSYQEIENLKSNIELITPFLDSEIYNHNIPCSVAGFGIAHNDVISNPIQNQLFFPKSDPKGCDYENEYLDEDINDDDDDDEEDGDEDEDIEKPKTVSSVIHSWLSPKKAINENINSNRDQNHDHKKKKKTKSKYSKLELKEMKKKYKSSYHKIFVIERGECMFEEKARKAEERGASAVIIVNGEDKKRFIMAASTNKNAAKQQKEKEETGSDDEDEDDISEDVLKAVEIPVVMISKEHGDLLSMIHHRLSNNNNSFNMKQHEEKVEDREKNGPSMEVVVEVDKTVASQSQQEWPNVRVGENSIQVFGKGEWGAYLSAKNGNDWQLFIVKRQ
eukprot:CAMPEP_0114333130 /NCGR_PEP_ID=MMETSP0101-20121206/3554_1 /TAXON_ID=38822 ORGANISM="Pteridomonas danica, Strain PT" /NCGR_SAMPLE_ID=MMETSP0101 /ASSEMBLY_ACC=CAM_ASM_000211 /LENGTH=1141 /DNA_ID=CAMNT_0001464055 /DNA_START=1072 /DNA_END=4497 /DNA_ORIENTATION=+